jgi:hypothetical protein
MYYIGLDLHKKTIKSEPSKQSPVRCERRIRCHLGRGGLYDFALSRGFKNERDLEKRLASVIPRHRKFHIRRELEVPLISEVGTMTNTQPCFEGAILFKEGYLQKMRKSLPVGDHFLLLVTY